MWAAWRAAARRRRGFSLSRGSPWRARSALCRHSTATRTTSRFARVGLRLTLAQVSAWAAAGASSATSASRAARSGVRRTKVMRNKVTASRCSVLRSVVRPTRAPERSFGNPADSSAEPRGFASRPRGRFALSGGEPECFIGYATAFLRASGRIGVLTPDARETCRSDAEGRGGRIRTGETSASQTRRSNQAELHPEGSESKTKTRASSPSSRPCGRGAGCRTTRPPAPRGRNAKSGPRVGCCSTSAGGGSPRDRCRVLPAQNPRSSSRS